jgi:hypothetical protein
MNPRPTPLTTIRKAPRSPARSIHLAQTGKNNDRLPARVVDAVQYPSWEHLRRELGVGQTVFRFTIEGKVPAEAGLAVRLARVLGVSVDDVLSGRVAKMLACVFCEQLSPPTEEGQRSVRASSDWRAPGVCPVCLRALPIN